MTRQDAIRLIDPAASPRPPAGWRRLETDLPLADETWHVAVDVQDRRAHLADIVPPARALCDRVVAAVRQSESLGKPISCRKGCGTCCGKYLVTVTRPEGFRLMTDYAARPKSTFEAIARGLDEASARMKASRCG